MAKKQIVSRIINLGSGWEWVVSFMQRRSTPKETNLGTNWVGGLDSVEQEKHSSPMTGTEQNFSVVQEEDS